MFVVKIQHVRIEVTIRLRCAVALLSKSHNYSKEGDVVGQLAMRMKRGKIKLVKIAGFGIIKDEGLDLIEVGNNRERAASMKHVHCLLACLSC